MALLHLSYFCLNIGNQQFMFSVKRRKSANGKFLFWKCFVWQKNMNSSIGRININCCDLLKKNWIPEVKVAHLNEGILSCWLIFHFRTLMDQHAVMESIKVGGCIFLECHRTIGMVNRVTIKYFVQFLLVRKIDYKIYAHEPYNAYQNTQESYHPGYVACIYIYIYINGLVQERHNSIADILELGLSCANP